MSFQTSAKEDLIREQILQAARQLFQQYGLQKVTMDDVAKAIKKGRSSIYYYFKSKEELFDAVMDIEIGRLIAEMTRGVDMAANVEEKVFAFFSSKLNLIGKRRPFFAALDAGMDAEELASYTRAKDDIHRRLFRMECMLLEQILNDAVRNREIRPLSQAECEHLVFSLVSCLHGLKREMAVKDDFGNVDAVTRVLARTVIQGLRL